MIDSKRLNHILGVARQAKEYARMLCPNDEKFAEDMFVLGMLHDLGYEFSDNANHAQKGAEILKRQGYRFSQEVGDHGRDDVLKMSDALFILNCADMTVDGLGNLCSMQQRLEDIASRYSKDFEGYKKCVREIALLKQDLRYCKIFKQGL